MSRQCMDGQEGDADVVLKPYVDTAPENMVLLLFLDSYHCHMMNSVVNAIQDLGVEVEHVPGAVPHFANLHKQAI